MIMPKSFNQKLKILYLMKFLQEETDREHPVSVKDIIQNMEAYGISVERKTVYDDIETLRTFGMRIGSRRGKNAGFYLEERAFELPELKFLMDAVQSSKFITEEQTAALVRKLEDLASVHEAKKLKNQVFLMQGIKTLNEEIYMNIETIYDAVSADRQISFRYYQWTLSRELEVKRNGERYRVSPGKLMWNNDSYYLLGLDETSGIVKHYRVDKMRDVIVEAEKRGGEAVFRDFDMGRFSAETFGMFHGKETILRIRFSNELVGVVLDRFGKTAVLQRSDENHFTLQAHIRVSGQFFGWLTGLGEGAEIVSPENVRKEYVSFLKKTLKTYES